MSHEKISVDALDNGSELAGLYDAFGIRFFSPEVQAAWEKVVDDGQYVFLAAKLGSLTAGMVSVNRQGPSLRQARFAEHVFQAFPDDKKPMAVINGLLVKDEFRRRGVASAIMTDVETRILQDPSTENKAVLTVRTDNAAAINLYRSRGYDVVSVDGKEIIIVQATDTQPDGTLVPVEVESIAMYKELDEPGKE